MKYLSAAFHHNKYSTYYNYTRLADLAPNASIE